MTSAAYACNAHNTTFTVKVGFGDDTVRLKLTPNMTFADLMVGWCKLRPVLKAPGCSA